MKEKTFEELIEEKAFIENKIFEDDEDVKVVEFEDVLKLMQQVREATIAECDKAIEENTTIELYKHEWEEISNAIYSLPTDRINLEQ